MTSPAPLPWLLLPFVVVAGLQCSNGGEPSVDASGRDGAGAADAATDVEALGDGEADAATSWGAGPITLVAETVELSTERLCDLDGDGSLDNVLADLGPTEGMMLAMAVNSFVGGAYLENYPVILHLPWVDDRDGPNDPEATVMVFEGLDDEHFDSGGRDRTDDFSGEEPFVVRSAHLDGCGEPLWAFEDAEIRDGSLATLTPGALFAPLSATASVLLRGAALHASIEPGGTEAGWKACGYAPIHSLGEIDTEIIADASLLEILLGGGANFGFPTIPGLNPDVDVDGDGLERFVLDEAGRIELCVDGDATTIPGFDCWRDERMADAMALTVAMAGVAARFEGREPDWEERVQGTCEAPPEESLWNPR